MDLGPEGMVGLTTEGSKGTFWADASIWYLYCGVGYMSAYIFSALFCLFLRKLVKIKSVFSWCEEITITLNN